MTSEKTTENNIALFLRSVTSLMITFYISYLFFHFIVLNLIEINNTLLIIVCIWAGHIILNVTTLLLKKNMNFGDLFIRIEYRGLGQNSSQMFQILIRSIVTTTIFYTIIYYNYLEGWSLTATISSFILVLLLNFRKIKMNHIRLSFIDWVTGTLVSKRQ